jgi:hypothetical protein
MDREAFEEIIAELPANYLVSFSKVILLEIPWYLSNLLKYFQTEKTLFVISTSNLQLANASNVQSLVLVLKLVWKLCIIVCIATEIFQ